MDNDIDIASLCGNSTTEDVERTMNRPMTFDWETLDAQHEAFWSYLNKLLVEQGREPVPISEDFVYYETRARMIELCQQPEQCTLANFEKVKANVFDEYSSNRPE
ncbi:MAG: hypothetical protein AAFQ95_15380 [Cyanobacteria bacterium J06621_3]